MPGCTATALANSAEYNNFVTSQTPSAVGNYAMKRTLP
jgi:hypothetical protein